VLVTRSGEAAQLDNGGEFPIPVPQSLGTVTIEWREFGVILQALPIVISPTRLRQQVYAEVSEKDVSNAITFNGTTVPGITRRRVQSTVEMEFGQTLVLGGLINTQIQATIQKTPFLGELPLIGAAFTNTSYNHSEVELIIMITPEYVSPVPSDRLPQAWPGRTTTFPTDRELYLHGLIEVPSVGPECGTSGGACDPNFSVNVRTETPWPDTTMPGTPVPVQSFDVLPTTGPTIYRGGDAASPTMAPPGQIRPGSSGLIAPPGVGPGDQSPPPPSPSGDPSVSSRTQNGVKSRNSVRSLAPRMVAPRPQPIVDGPTQAGFQSIGNPSNSGNRQPNSGNVQPASAVDPAESRSLPPVKF
jgi:pilus assembly protein CpaC